MSLDERHRLIEEMLQLYAQNVPELRVKGYLRHLQKVPTEKLRTAIAGCVEQGSQRGAPTVAEILRRAADAGTARSAFREVEDSGPRHRECKKVVAHTPSIPFVDPVTGKSRPGTLLCCREEGHMGDCEVWFSHEGRQPGDAGVIERLVKANGDTVSRPEDLLEDIL